MIILSRTRPRNLDHARIHAPARAANEHTIAYAPATNRAANGTAVLPPLPAAAGLLAVIAGRLFAALPHRGLPGPRAALARRPAPQLQRRINIAEHSDGTVRPRPGERAVGRAVGGVVGERWRGGAAGAADGGGPAPRRVPAAFQGGGRQRRREPRQEGGEGRAKSRDTRNAARQRRFAKRRETAAIRARNTAKQRRFAKRRGTAGSLCRQGETLRTRRGTAKLGGQSPTSVIAARTNETGRGAARTRTTGVLKRGRHGAKLRLPPHPAVPTMACCDAPRPHV